MIHDTQRDEHNLYAIIKTMYCRGYDRNGFVGTQAVGQMMYGYVISCTQVHELPQSHCGDNREGTLFS